MMECSPWALMEIREQGTIANGIGEPAPKVKKRLVPNNYVDSWVKAGGSKQWRWLLPNTL